MDNIGFVVDEKLSVIGGAVVCHGGNCPWGGRHGQGDRCAVEGCHAGKVVPVYGKHWDTVEEVPSRPNNMPAINNEEAALLGCMDDIELRNVQLQIPSARRFSDSPCGKVRVRTDTGEITVAVQGDRSKPAILTYNDIGLNYKSFQTFFNYVDMRVLMENFCVYHVTAPGQEEGAPTLPDE